MNITQLDLNLMQVFLQIYENKSLSLAAEHLNLSQPAISHSLKKLRDYFDDPIFVRSRGGMVATPFSDGIYPNVKQAITLLQTPILAHKTFSPEQCNTVIKVAVSDFNGAFLLPKLAVYLSEHAPNVELQVVHLDRDTVHQHLASGKLDFAIGSLFAIADAGLYQTRLFEDNYVCVVSNKHSHIQNTLSFDDYITAQHVIFSVEEKGVRDSDAYLKQQQQTRRVVMRVPYAANIVKIVEQTDYICALPTKIATAYCQGLAVKQFPFPFSIPHYQVNLYWHQRTDCSAQHKWFRQTLKSLM
ncbi:LysR family transcriptional regulator [Flocculibacter collagenilyticus]|uniref:LysR family transcriptional regulator n=1 Tax=Flocculibacter collagenilyticus TaxID=2744479 RepID=UPI0018F4C99F|nr:LysR family transcriptional regulator [Flocculibacter collagenilyticus]